MAARTDDIASLQKPLGVSELRCFTHVNNTEAFKDMTQASDVRNNLQTAFQELKTSFKSMRASEAALEALAQEQRLPGVEDVRNASVRLTAEVEDQLISLEESKESCESAGEELDIATVTMRSALSKYEKQRIALVSTVEAHSRQVDVLLPRLAKTLGMDVVQLAGKLWTDEPNELDGVIEHCRTKVQSQLSEIASSSKEVDEMKAKLQATRTRLEQAREAAKEQHAVQESEISEATQTPSHMDESKKQHVVQLQEMEVWALAMQSTMRKISGVHVETLGEDSMSVRFKAGKSRQSMKQPRELTLALRFDPSNARLLGATLSPCTVHVADIVVEGIRMNDPRLVVREVRARAEQHERLLLELDELGPDYAVSFDDVARQAVIMLPSGVVCTLELQRGYPDGDASVISVTGDSVAVSMMTSEAPHDKLSELVERVNDSVPKPRTTKQLISALEFDLGLGLA